MATVNIKAALGNLGLISNFVSSNVHTTLATGTAVTVKDAEGDGFTLTGTGLTYSATGVSGGKFTSLTIFTAAGDTLETVTNFNVLAKPLYTLFAFGGLSAAVLDLFKADDTITGSAVADLLTGYAGNDTIKGGAGNDIIGGSVGKDKLFGQAGADVFLFVAGDGKDHIMDFTDLGGKSDDRIGLTHKMYDAMHVTETATGVTLSFGTKGTIMVDNWHAADVDISDFVFG